MYSKLPNATRAVLLSVGIVLGGSVIDCATADVFLVQLSGTFTSSMVPQITPPTPFTGAFYVDTSVPGIVHVSTSGGGTATGYQDAAISPFSISAGGVTFSHANIVDKGFPIPPTAAVWFSQDLANGATPSMEMAFLANRNQLSLGFSDCNSSTCLFSNFVIFFDPSLDEAIGPLTVTVIGFAGTPGAANCHDQSTAALAQKYTNMPNATKALGYPSVKALQTAITTFCGN